MSERKTMFGEAVYEKYADIVRMDTIKNANESIRKLKEEFKTAETRAKKVRVKRVTVNASNRAFASAKRERLSVMERHSLRVIGKKYRSAYKGMIIPSRHARIVGSVGLKQTRKVRERG